MIKLIENQGVETENGVEKLKVVIYADTKAEVTDGMLASAISGCDLNSKLAAGSVAIISSFNAGMYDSSETWHWKE